MIKRRTYYIELWEFVEPRGVFPHLCSIFYLTIFEKMIMYGSGSSYVNTVRVNNKLKKIQRKALLKITKCYPTVSNEALWVLAGVLPLDLKMRQNKKLYDLYKVGKEVNILDKRFTINDVEIKMSELFSLGVISILLLIYVMETIWRASAILQMARSF